jgi:fatty acid desaturase
MAIQVTQSNRRPPARDDRPERRSKPALRDIAEMWRFAIQAGISGELRALHRPRLGRSLLAAGMDWILIVLAVAATARIGWAALPFAMLVIGNRQRALGNLLHDASHYCIDSRRKRSDLLANLLFCWPLWVSMAIYRDEHGRHHNFLGDPVRDPDFIHDERRLSRGWLRLWIDQLLSPRALRASLLGDIARMDWMTRLGVTCWWLAVLLAISILFGMRTALGFVALWVAAKTTVFHAITAFREISDHVGLDPRSLIGFSRSHPFGSLLGAIFHPHHNGYHLLHHLTPGMPFHALPRGHELLMRWPSYAAGEHCHGYFFGEISAVYSWVRRAGTAERQSEP